jgi:hypothetical protein
MLGKRRGPEEEQNISAGTSERSAYEATDATCPQNRMSHARDRTQPGANPARLSGGVARCCLRADADGNEAGFVGERHELRAITTVELRQNATDMCLGRKRADDEASRYVGVAQPCCDKPQDLPFALRQLG